MLNRILNKSEELQIKKEQLDYRYKRNGWTAALQLEVNNLEQEVKKLKNQLDTYLKDNNII